MKMKFKFIGAALFDEDGEEVRQNAYCGNSVRSGDIVELEGHFARKALSNDNYERVVEEESKPRVRASRKKEKEVIISQEVVED